MKFAGILMASFLVACGSSDDGGTHAASGGSGGKGGTGGSSGTGATGGSAGSVQTGNDVTLASGKVHGSSDGKIRVFRGIPYAEPPLGTLRWKPPQKKAPWPDVFDATKPGPKCPQLDALGINLSGTEDCLTLDVWTPDPAPSAPRPVMVWIHGGGFFSGTGTDPTYEGTHIVPAGDVVLVDINYRLGALGFLAHSLLTAEDASHPSSGNYGFEDQQLALQWVQDNAAAFGGDPKNVTIFGESAGGISVCTHLTAPKSQGLFHKAIVESGPCSLLTTTLASAETQGTDLATKLGCTDLACLRGKTAEQVVKALPLKKAVIFGPGASWSPNIDGLVLPQAPASAIAAGGAAKVPLVIGTNAEEGQLFILLAGLSGLSDADYTTTIQAIGTTLGIDGSKVLTQYPSASYPSPADALSAALTDGGFICPTRRIARALAQTQDTYLYFFTHPIPLLGQTHAFHAAELPFVFQSSLIGFTPSGQEIELSNAIMGYWTKLAASGDPNGASAVAWPKYDTTGDQHLVLDLTISGATGLKKSECDFWDSL